MAAIQNNGEDLVQPGNPHVILTRASYCYRVGTKIHGAALVGRPMNFHPGLSGELLNPGDKQPYQRPHPSGGHNWGSRRGVYLRSVEISGPFPVGEAPAVPSASARASSDTTAGTVATADTSDTPSRRRILVCRPTDSSQEAACASAILSALARRAYRRPVIEVDVAGLLRFYEEGRDEGTFESGIEMAVRRLLVSPEFLFRTESDRTDIAPTPNYQVGDLDLASRVSFCL